MRDYLKPSDFVDCPVWRFDEDADIYLPVRTVNDLPEMVRDLRILAEFSTPSGKTIRGCVVGIENIFAMGLFFNERVYHLNKNLRDLSKEQIEEFLSDCGLVGELTFDTLLPLRYQTKWGGDVFNDFSGIFEMPLSTANI